MFTSKAESFSTDAKLVMFIPVCFERWIFRRLHEMLFCDEVLKPVCDGLMESLLHFDFVGQGFPPNSEKLIKNIKICLMLAVNQRVSDPKKLAIDFHRQIVLI